MAIESSAPTRIDLAGGTVDIWPLYLFHPGARTVNFAITLPARCRVTAREGRYVRIESVDTAQSLETTLDRLREEKELELLVRLIGFFAPETGLELVTECAAPAGSGLGGSSALNIAVCGALNAFTSKGYTRQELLTIARNIETQVIRVPAGEQDYYPAMYGGVGSIHLGVTGVERRGLEVDLRRLGDRVVLCYTGKPHFSGTNNWEIFKKHIDGDARTYAQFERIADVSRRMEEAMLAADLDWAASLLDEEWRARKELSPGVSTPVIERLMEVAGKAGALGAKVCGAGGGGCVTFITAEGRKPEVTEALRAAGAEVLDCLPQADGLDVRVVD